MRWLETLGLLCVAMLCSSGGWAADDAASAPDGGPALSSQLEDAPQPFVPKQARTERQRDELEALSLFGAARMHEQRGDLHQALRLYQRALRLDPDSSAALRDVFRLARALDRPEEAMRYALRMVEQHPDRPDLLKELAVYLTEEEDFAEALQLYEKVIELEKKKPKSAELVSLLLETGRLHYLLENHKQAADAFAAVMDALANPDDYGLNDRMVELFSGKKGVHYELFGESLLAAGRLDEALEAFRRAHEHSGDDAMLAYREAQVLARQEKPDEALARLEEYLAGKGAAALMEPYELLEELLAKLKHPKQLLPRLEKALAKDEGNVPLRYFLASKYLEAENWLMAESLYFELVNESPAAEAYQGLITAYQKLNNVRSLASLLGQVVGRSGSLSAVADQAASIAEDKKLLEALYKEAAAGDSGMTSDALQGVLQAVALLCLDAEQFERAAELYELALINQPDDAAELYATWGLGLLAGEKNEQAAAIFQRAIDENVLPDSPAFHTYLSMALELAEKIDQAVDAAEKAAEIGEQTAELLSRVPLIYYRAGMMSQAREGFIELIDRFDSEYDTEVRAAMRDARLVLSNIAVMEGDISQAEEWLEQILDEYPSDIGAMNDLGYLWADQGKNLERALEMIEQAVAAEPDNQAYLDSLGWVYFRLGRFEQAVAELEKAAEGEETDGVILDHLGDAYLAAHRTSDARAAWKKAVAAFQRDEEPEKAAEVRRKLRRQTKKQNASDASDAKGANDG